MGFRLFGVDVEVQLGFWMMSFFLGWDMSGPPGREVLIWMAVVFISVLVHEYGHAFAIKRHRIEPEIALHWMGGTTSWRQILPLGRLDRIIISLAGPFAGFGLAALVFAVMYFAPVGVLRWLDHPLAKTAIWNLIWVNLIWGGINLLPVLPFDGGHVLEQALGPTRVRLTAIVSLVAGLVVAAAFMAWHMYWGAMIFGFGALRSFQQFRASEAPVRVVRPRTPPRPKTEAEPLPPEVAEQLRLAKEALAADENERAIAIADRILHGVDRAPSVRAMYESLQMIAWGQLGAGRIEAAAEALGRAAKIDTPDPALAGAVAMAKGDAKEARRVFEAARAAGDDRKEVVGPLIQLLIGDGEIARAAATAFDIVESLSEEDARQMGKIAFEGRAFEWSARLYEAVFRREGSADDAYEAARGLAQGGDVERSLELLRRAVAAGFTDRARAWSDAALEALRQSDHLEAVLPRP